MPTIGQPEPIAPPRGANYSPDRLVYPSADGQWTLEYHTPREWHMDATGWQARLLHGGRDVTRDHAKLRQIAGDKGFRGERHFQPWRSDGSCLALVTWDDEPMFLYDVGTRTAVHLTRRRRRYVVGAQFAPDIDRLLITSQAEGLLIDSAGAERGLARWDIEKHASPRTFWMNSGGLFFLLARPARGGRALLSFFRGHDGSFVEAHAFDPSNLVPYETERYAKLPRNGLCLTLVDPPGVKAVGLLLDIWNEVRFDQRSNTLVLSVLRPVSAPSQDDGAPVCRAEHQWVAVQLGDGRARGAAMTSDPV